MKPAALAALEPKLPFYQANLMFKVNLRDYLLPGIQMEWLEKYHESLRGHVENVRKAGMLLGVPWPQLLIHDASKYSTQEFPAYARQFCGDAGDPYSFALAWQHHQNSNEHHWEYWVTRSGFKAEINGFVIDAETKALPMPQIYVREMVADWMASEMSYQGSWSIRKWWLKRKDKMLLHPNTRLVVQTVLEEVNYGE